MGSDPSPSTHASLLAALVGGPETEPAWRIFLQRYGPLIAAWCRRQGLQHADAEDVAQEVLRRLAGALHTFRYDPNRSFRAYLKTCVERVTYDLWSDWRRPGARGSGDSDIAAALAQVPDPDADSLVEELNGPLEADHARCRQIMARVQARVVPRTWQAFTLTAIEGVPGKEVAERLGIAVATVFQYTYRVGKLLKAEAAAVSGHEGPTS